MSRGKHRAPRRNAALALVDDLTADWIDQAARIFVILALALLIVLALVMSHAGAATVDPSALPSIEVTVDPSGGPTQQPTQDPTLVPTVEPPSPTPAPVVPPPTVVPAPVPAGLTPAQIAANQAHDALLAQLKAQKIAAASAAELAHDQRVRVLAAHKLAVAQARHAEQFTRADVTINTFYAAHGRPHLILEVGATKIYWAKDGRLADLTSRPAGPLSVAWLSAHVPNEWISHDGSTVTLKALLVITDDSVVTAGKPDLGTLGMTTGAGVWATKGTFQVDGVTLTSADNHGQPLIAADRNRPFVRAGQHGTLLLDNATMVGLGNENDPDNAGITWGHGATGHARNVTVEGGIDGLRLASSSNVDLDHVKVSGSKIDGIVLAYDLGTKLSRIESRDNGGDGVSLSGDHNGRTLEGIVASGNGQWGLDVFNASSISAKNISTGGDKTGGIRLADCESCSVGDSTSTGDQVGVGVAHSSVVMTHLAIHGADAGMHFYRGAHGVTASDVSISGAESAVMIGGDVAGVLLDHPVIHGSAKSAISNHSPDLVLLGGDIDGGGVGIATDATMRMNDTHVTGVREGIHVVNAKVTAARLYVLATQGGIHVEGGRMDLSDSTVHAVFGIKGNVVMHGRNDVSLPDFPWLGAVAIGAILAAFVLEALHSTRQPKRSARNQIPAHVLNRA